MAKSVGQKDNLKQSASNSAKKQAIKNNENITSTAKKGLNNRTSSFIKKAITSNESDVASKVKSFFTYDASKNLPAKDNTNILHSFASYNTLFTLSGVTEQELRDHSFLTNPVHDIVARSGGIGSAGASEFRSATGNPNEDRANEQEYLRQSGDRSREVLARGHNIFFEDVNILSTVSPSEERGLGDFTKMEFKLHEPFGITLIEKIKAAALLNGFRDHMDAPMLLTIEFKGYNEYGNPAYSKSITRKIPIVISRVELDVNEGGAIYDVIAVRYQDLAYDDRFKFPRTNIPVLADSLTDAARQIEEKLQEAMEVERDEHKVREVIDDYEIVFDPEIIAKSRDYAANKPTHNVDQKNPNEETLRAGGGSRQRIEIKQAEGNVTTLTALTKMIEDMVRSTKGYSDIANEFWTTYLRKAGAIGSREKADPDTVKGIIKDQNKFSQIVETNPFVDWFKVKTAVRTHTESFDKITKQHRKTIVYKVIPYKIHVLKFIKPGVYLNKSVSEQGVQKEYNYIYTGQNHDIQNLRINYKAAYYQRNVIEPEKANSGLFQIIDNTITKIFGTEDKERQTGDGIRSYPSVIKSRNLLEVSDKDKGKEARKSEFYDYLTNPVADMMRIEMEILGDPAYICQDQFIPLSGENEHIPGPMFNYLNFSFSADSYTPLIKLNYSFPADIDENKGLMFTEAGKREHNLFFEGVYMVAKIESRFNQGQFTQNLTCVRLNNQNGEGRVPFKVNTDFGTEDGDSGNSSSSLSGWEKFQIGLQGGQKMYEKRKNNRNAAIKAGVQSAEDDR